MDNVTGKTPFMICRRLQIKSNLSSEVFIDSIGVQSSSNNLWGWAWRMSAMEFEPGRSSAPKLIVIW